MSGVRDIQHVVVIGGGLMGSGIAQVCATHGFPVELHDVDELALSRALSSIDESLRRLAKRGALAEPDIPAILARIATSTDLGSSSALQTADLVIEAVPEVLEVKRGVFAQLDHQVRPDAILASNTSNLSITSIASATTRPDRVIGMHWFNPAPLMKLIEIVRGLETSDETVALLSAFTSSVGKEAVLVADAQGFITTRLAALMAVEAFRMLEEGVATREDIDKAIRLGLNHPMGPFELSDLTGLDTTLFIAEALSAAYGERFRPPNLLRNLVSARRLGRKTGRGSYDYGTGTQSR